MNWLLLKNSLLVSAGAAAAAAVLGLVLALGLAATPRRWRTVLVALAILTLVLPPFVVTNAWLYLLGPTGVWRAWLPLNIMSPAGAACVLALMYWPVTLLALLASWRRLEPHLLESDPAMRGRHLLFGLLLPLARGTLARAGLITFVLALNNFAVPAILQVKVYPAEIWIRFSTNFDTLGALRLSAPVVLAPLLLVWWLSATAAPWPHRQAPLEARLFRRQLGLPLLLASATVALPVLLLSTLLPLGQLLAARSTWTELPGALAAGQSAFWNSLVLSAGSALLAVGAAILVSGRGRSRRGVLNSLLWLPFLVPGVLLGVGLILVFNRPGLSWFYSSAGIVFLACGLRYLAPALGLVNYARGRVDRQLLDVARLEGARPWQLFSQVEWPQIAASLAAAGYVVFLLCLWDVESMLLISPPGLETLAMRIFNLLHYGHNAQVDALCLALLGLGLAPLALGALFLRTPALRQARARGARFRPGALLVLGFAAPSFFLFGCTPAGSSQEAALQSRIFGRVEIIGKRGAGVGELNKPRSVAVDSQDALYVVDMTGRVQKFSSNGVYLLSWQMPQTDLGKPKGMCRDNEGNIVVLEPHYARVNHFTPSGKLVCQWGEHGTNAGQLSVPRAVGVNARDEIFVTEYQQAERVQKFVWDQAARKAGQPPRWVADFGRSGNGPGEFSRPEGLCVDGQGLVYVADSCNHRIQVFSGEGRLLRSYGKPGRGPGELSYPYDICVDREGRQYVCEFGNSRIQVFDPAGRPVEIIGGPGAAPGEFSNPWGVALDSAGNLYVADSQNHRVQKLIRKGQGLLAGRARDSSTRPEPALAGNWRAP